MPGCLDLLARFGVGTCGHAPTSNDEEGELIRFGVALRCGSDSTAPRRCGGDNLGALGTSKSVGKMIPVINLDVPQCDANDGGHGAPLAPGRPFRGDRSGAAAQEIALGLPPTAARALRRGAAAQNETSSVLLAPPQGTSTAVAISPTVGASIPPARLPRPVRGATHAESASGDVDAASHRSNLPKEVPMESRDASFSGRVLPPLVVTGSSVSLTGALTSRSRSHSPLYAGALASRKIEEGEGHPAVNFKQQHHGAAQLSGQQAAPLRPLVPPPVSYAPLQPSTDASDAVAPAPTGSTSGESPSGASPPAAAAFGSYPFGSGALSAMATAAASVAAAASAAAAAAASAAAGGAGADAWLWRSPSRVDMSAEIASAGVRAQTLSRSLSHTNSDTSVDLEGVLPEGVAALRSQQQQQQHVLMSRAATSAHPSTVSLQSLPSLHRSMHGVSSAATLQALTGANASAVLPRKDSHGACTPSRVLSSARSNASSVATLPPTVANWPAGPSVDPLSLLDEQMPFAAPGLAMRAVATRPAGKFVPSAGSSGSPGAPETPRGLPGAFRTVGSPVGSSTSASPRASRLGPDDVEYVEFVLDTFELVGFVHVTLPNIRTRVDPAVAEAAVAARQAQIEADAAAMAAEQGIAPCEAKPSSDALNAPLTVPTVTCA